jgi:hypothetical protein
MHCYKHTEQKNSFYVIPTDANFPILPVLVGMDGGHLMS